MHKRMIVMSVAGVLGCSGAIAQSTANYMDRSGAVVGSVVSTYTPEAPQDPRVTNYRDQAGSVYGSSVTYSDGTTQYRGVNGEVVGSKYDPQPYSTYQR